MCIKVNLLYFRCILFTYILFPEGKKGCDIMSNDFEFRKHMRDRKRKQKRNRTIAVSLLSIIIITVLSLCVKGIFTKISKNRTEEGEFIFNGYVYPMPAEKNTDILADAVKADGVKKAYLTFDDGPNNSVTPQVLDVLRKYDVKATFFLVGSLIEKYPDMARRLYDEGHCLANHSYNHNYSELYADEQSFMNQMNQTEELIFKTTCNDKYPKIMRFPGGGYNAGKHGEAKQKYKESLKVSGYRYCDWNSLTGDAEKQSPSEEYVTERLMATVKEKEDVVVLMHDAIAKSVTARALPGIIEYLISQGYTFDTLDNV